jgi:formiminoglutamate deiminase
MYSVATTVTPDSYYRLARAVFGEMALAGFTAVGEFNYLHHAPDGTPYSDPNAMGEALVVAATEAGLRITLLDTCYLWGGLDAGSHQAPGEHQRRFSDGGVDAWLERVGALDALVNSESAKVGMAVHSVRAVDPRAIREIARAAAAGEQVLHVHVSEQPAENEQCRVAFGCTPIQLLAESGALGPRTTAVHATHVTDSDLEQLATAGSTVCLCPTTERDLADGIGRSGSMSALNIPIAIGTDSHALIDPFGEVRAVELDQRLTTGTRGVHSVEELVRMATTNGYRALGWSEGGTLRAGALADFVTVGLDSVRLAGFDVDSVLAGVTFGAGAADVTSVVIGGKRVVDGGVHSSIDVVSELGSAIAEVVQR